MTDQLEDRDQLTRFLIAGRRRARRARPSRGHLATDPRRDGLPRRPLAELLGETCAAAALFTGHAKVDGRLSVQLRGHGALRTLFAECTAAGTLRGIAQLAEDRHGLARPARTRPRCDARDHHREPVARWPRTHALPGTGRPGIGFAWRAPSRTISAAPNSCPRGCCWPPTTSAAAGLMLQKLPGDAGDDDGWTRAGALFDTLTPRELLDWPATPCCTGCSMRTASELLGPGRLRFACSCSRERVEAMLTSLGARGGPCRRGRRPGRDPL